MHGFDGRWDPTGKVRQAALGLCAQGTHGLPPFIVRNFAWHVGDVARNKGRWHAQKLDQSMHQDAIDHTHTSAVAVKHSITQMMKNTLRFPVVIPGTHPPQSVLSPHGRATAALAAL